MGSLLVLPFPLTGVREAWLGLLVHRTTPDPLSIGALVAALG